MGLLDDAIREHLDLKRRRGADPEEVAREENEALGPPRMGRFAGDAEEPAFADELPGGELAGDATAEPRGAVGAGFAEDGDRGYAEDTGRGYAEDLDDGIEETGGRYADEPGGAYAAGPGGRYAEDPGEEPWLEERREIVPETLDQSTSEFTPPGVDEPEETAAGDRGDDVLEETPDFLQETPEHDRLWFEQRPPRDFDFDK